MMTAAFMESRRKARHTTEENFLSVDTNIRNYSYYFSIFFKVRVLHSMNDFSRTLSNNSVILIMQVSQVPIPSL